MQQIDAFVVSDEQKQFFQVNGYLVLDAITTREEIDRLRRAYDLLLALHTGHASSYQGNLREVDASLADTGRILLTGPQRYHQAFKGTRFETNALRVVRQLIGGEGKVHDSYLLYKPARLGGITPWHQEDAYLASERTYDLLTFWLALQETPEESGCMQFLPGSHTLECLPHSPWPGSDGNLVLAADSARFDATRAIACPLPAGGATVHTTRTLHYAGANLSDIPRRAFILDVEFPRRARAGGTTDGRE